MISVEQAMEKILSYIDVLNDFPRLKFVGAHFGLNVVDFYAFDLATDQVALMKRFPNACFDLAVTLVEPLTQDQVEVIREVGANRILWGSDWHSSGHSWPLFNVLNSCLSEKEKDMIVGENARRLIET